MAKVKCPGCGEYFWRESSEHIQVKNRYWHKSCYENRDKIPSEAKEELYEYIKKLFKIQKISPKISRQVSDYVGQGFTYEGIKLTLEYFFEKKGNPLSKANGGIGIVPYVYEEAKEDYIRKMRLQRQQEATDMDIAVEEKIIKLKMSQIRGRISKEFIDIDEL